MSAWTLSAFNDTCNGVRAGPAWPVRSGMLLALLFGALWAVLEIALGSALRQNYDLTQVVWCRYATHLALLLVVFAWRGPQHLWRTKRPMLQVGRSFLMLVMPLSFIAALAQGAPASLVWAEYWVAPLLTLLVVRTLMRERVSAALWVCAAAVLGAAWLVHMPPRPESLGQIMWPLVMALSFSLYVVATRALRGERLRVNLFHTALAVFVVLTPRMLQVWKTPPLHDALVLMGIGAVGLLALALLDRALERCSVAIVSCVIGLHLPMAVVLTRGYHGVAVDLHDLLGIVLLAAMFVWLWLRAGRLVQEEAR